MTRTRLQTFTTPTGHLRADYILARLERAVVRAHGREAFEGYRLILAKEAAQIARGSKRPGRVHRLIWLEKHWVEIVGQYSPQQWDGWRNLPMPPPTQVKYPVVKWWNEGGEERPGPHLQLVP